MNRNTKEEITIITMDIKQNRMKIEFTEVFKEQVKALLIVVEEAESKLMFISITVLYLRLLRIHCVPVSSRSFIYNFKSSNDLSW